jgi:SNF family Na+-dependent transporter
MRHALKLLATIDATPIRDDLATDAGYIIQLTAIAAVLVGPMLMPILRVAAASSLSLSFFILKRALKLIADKIVENLLFALVLWLVGAPALALLVRLVQIFFDR